MTMMTVMITMHYDHDNDCDGNYEDTRELSSPADDGHGNDDYHMITMIMMIMRTIILERHLQSVVGV